MRNEKVKAKLGELIKDARLDKGITQQELSQLLGVSQSKVSKIESGKLTSEFALWLDLVSELNLKVDSNSFRR